MLSDRSLFSGAAKERHSAHAAPATAAPRKKKFASRSRTGCLTCRKRRLKCDEAWPQCRRCTTGGYGCRYGNLLPAGEAAGDAIGDAAPLQQREKRVFAEAEPPDWDYMQTVRFYYTYVKAGRAVEGGRVQDPPFRLVDATRYTAMVISTQLGFIAKTRGRTLVYGDTAASAQLWNSYSRYLNKLIHLVNVYLKETTPAATVKAISYMSILMATDMAVESRLWQAHANGCLAYVNALGGAQIMVDWHPEPPTFFYRFFRRLILHNTTTPPREHIRGYDDYTDKQLAVFLDDKDFSADLPCPPPQKILLVHLTRLRHQVGTASVPMSSEALASIVAGHFNTLCSLDGDIDRWAETVSGFAVAVNKAMAEICRDAIWLHVMLALPRPAMLLWAQTQPPLMSSAPGTDALDKYRLLYRSRLVSQLRKIQPQLQYPPAIFLPLVVVGVASVDGSNHDRSFVDQSIYDIWQRPVGAPGSFACLKKLREFWASGKTAWDDCFYEATPG